MPPPPDNKDRQLKSLRSIEAGGLPLDAVERLTEMASRQGTPSEFFTSNFSASELILTHECGFEPLGQVMGTSVYHVGWQYVPRTMWAGSQELVTLTEANYNARHLAMNRLRQEGALLHADGVVGVRLEMHPFAHEPGLIEFKAIGTAVRATNAPPTPTGEPFLSALSGQEHWALRMAGLKPVGFGMGNCTYYQVASWATQNATTGGFFGSGWQNQELSDFTQAVYVARERAMDRLDTECRAVGAAGVIGVTIEADYEEVEIDTGGNSRREDLIVHFTAIGTAVQFEDTPQRTPPIPFFLPLENN